MLIDNTRLIVEVLIVGDLFLGHVDLGEAERASVHRGRNRVSLVTAKSHDVRIDHKLALCLGFNSLDGLAGGDLTVLVLALLPRCVLVLGCHLDQGIVFLRRAA